MANVSNLVSWLGSWCKPPRKHCGCGSSSHMPLKDPPKRPDPAIYDQQLVIAAGQMPTWDPADLKCLWIGGDWQDVPPNGQSAHLFPTLVAKPRNIGEAQAINTIVRASHSKFGLGMPRAPLPDGMISLPPGTVGEVHIRIPEDIPQQFMQPPGLHVELQHPHDKDVNNNHCSYNVTRLRIEGSAARNLVIACPVANQTGVTVTYQLRFYASVGVTATAPASVTLAPNEQKMLPISILIASDIHGGQMAASLEATLVATAPGFLDGVTWNLLVFD